MIMDVHQAVLVIRQLLGCCELNLDEMEEDTHDAIEFAEDFLNQYDGKSVVVEDPHIHRQIDL